MDRNWRIELFGGLRVLKDGVPIAPVAGTPARSLLALLVLSEGKWMDTDTLASRLWPETTPWRALDNLHAAVSKLRRELKDPDREILVRQEQLYYINTDKISSDITDFNRLAREITFAEGIDGNVKAALEEIEGLYKGDLLGRGDPCRNQALLAYNREYRTRMLGVWEIAAGLYLERGDVASTVQARWYVENIRRLQSQETLDERAAEYQEMPSKRRRGTRELLLETAREGKDDRER
jgi:DNA-binding SARP family transcriptional activator